MNEKRMNEINKEKKKQLKTKHVIRQSFAAIPIASKQSVLRELAL